MKRSPVHVTINQRWLEESGFAAGHAAYYFLRANAEGDEATIADRSHAAYFAAMHASISALDTHPELANCPVTDIIETPFDEGWSLAMQEWASPEQHKPSDNHGWCDGVERWKRTRNAATTE